jgi:hypothetical protein
MSLAPSRIAINEDYKLSKNRSHVIREESKTVTSWCGADPMFPTDMRVGTPEDCISLDHKSTISLPSREDCYGLDVVCPHAHVSDELMCWKVGPQCDGRTFKRSSPMEGLWVTGDTDCGRNWD